MIERAGSRTKRLQRYCGIGPLSANPRFDGCASSKMSGRPDERKEEESGKDEDEEDGSEERRTCQRLSGSK